ncbi:UNC-like C-terminal-domain-containing protein [Madurella fahalii]|uniref:UNC-like C-terminal-domain-containing protein n=1 Tax=Madurella fahalii TaxID=1157608 RepID=A0ABQ0GQT3_9PEZI
MRSPANWGRRIAPALVLLGLHATAAHGSRSGPETAVSAAPVATQAEVCESKTINYITHTLPQQCLRTSWTGPTPAAADGLEATVSATATAVVESPEATQDDGTQQGPEEDLAASSFMSFEEWKEMMLRKSGQDPANIKAHKQREHRAERDPNMNNGDTDSFGEDGEISIDFDALTEKVTELTSSSSDKAAPHADPDEKEEQVFYDNGKTQYYRSKDAGKTCKERFSYSSFDAGATILKTSPGAKNPKAILVENKDSYMLLECRTKNKFVIVELSDDILVDTVVLANFEFFSSMIRKFRVSVSDRYPVKLDKWVDLGTFEARNSRDIQPFLIEHPQIYTKYIRIEFLSHYGNEYYCPVSLLRVHGTRMLDTWKEPSQDDEPEQIEGAGDQPAAEPQQVQEPPAGDNYSTTATEEDVLEAVTEVGLSPWQPVFQSNFSLEICVLRSPTTVQPTPVSPSPEKPAGDSDTVLSRPSVAAGPDSASGPDSGPAAPESPAAEGQSTGASPSSAPSPPPHAGTSNTAGSPSNKQATDGAETPPPTPTTTTSRNKTSAASSPPSASPTVQESFFKTVTKRLQLLESNTSLSLQYIEEQSRFLQDVLLKLERKQITRVDTFLDSLNKTVLSELRNVRTQYDQIWQSTVLALETQREQSQREIVALTSRLNVLADEVVFQKRMAILQSVLLLACLVLVIFSRGGIAQALDPSTFPLPPTSSSAYYRRYARRADSLSGLSVAPSPSLYPATSVNDDIYTRPATGPGTGGPGGGPGPGLEQEMMSFSPSPQSASSASISTLAASALPRHLYPHALKSLPMTPEPSRANSRESTPAAIHLRQHHHHILPDDSPGYSEDSSTPVRRQHLRRGQGGGVGGGGGRSLSSDTELSSSFETIETDAAAEQAVGAAPPRIKHGEGAAEDEEEDEEAEDGVNQEREKPPLSRARSTLSQLKPLPALPEDPS